MNNFFENVPSFLTFIKITKSYGTYCFYDNHIKYILKYYKNDLENDTFFTDSGIIRFIDYMLICNCSGNTINKRLLVLKQYCKYANINLDPMKYKQKVVEKNFDYLNYHQVVALLSYLEKSGLNLHDRVLVKLFLDTGVRLSEMLKIEVQNIDFEYNCIHLLYTKNGNDRFVFFTDNTCILLKTYICENDILSGKLFEVSSSYVEKLFFKIRDDIGFKKFSPHVLRHTYATILVNENTNLEFIRNTLGHSSLEVTKKYLHMSQENLYQVYKEKFTL